MTACPDPTIVLQACTLDPATVEELAKDDHAWTIGAALQAATLDILALVPCGEHEDGGTVFGPPTIDPDCCGQVATGILSPVVVTGNCFKPDQWEWNTSVSWSRTETPASRQTSETSRLLRMLTKHAVCKLDTPRQPLYITGALNATDTKCPHVVIQVKATPNP